MIMGQLIWGFVGEFYDPRFIILFGNATTLFLTFYVVYRRRETVKPIYNQRL